MLTYYEGRNLRVVKVNTRRLGAAENNFWPVSRVKYNGRVATFGPRDPGSNPDEGQ